MDLAPPLPVGFVVALERLVTTIHTLPLRVFAGVCYLCITLGKAVVGCAACAAYPHHTGRTEACLPVFTVEQARRGLLPVWGWGVCLGEPFTLSGDEDGLPKGDFLVLRSRADLVSFTRPLPPAGCAYAIGHFMPL